MDKQSSEPIGNSRSGILNSTSGKSENNSIVVPQITLPKGGGALKGIDEKFSVNSANGTASISIPLPITSGRNGFQPTLALSYNSGSGNGVFGLGWNVDYPSIQRKTDKKLPRYFDKEESDVFMFSGAEDLVPSLKLQGGSWIKDEEQLENFRIKRYRPRIERLFARIERIQPLDQNIFYWKITTRDNIITIFGRSVSHRIADPNDSSRIFKWLPELSYDDKGSCILFEYKEENTQNVENTLHEKNRLKGLAKSTNNYLKRVKYGNIQPYYTGSDANSIYNPAISSSTEYLFELVFDYGEHGNNENIETLPWKGRIDAFSDYRPGFEIRIRRLCQRVLMFHHFTNKEFELADNETRISYLVRSLDLEYISSSDNNPLQSEVTYLKSIKQTGYKKNGFIYDQRSFPAMEFSYQLLKWNTEIENINSDSIVQAPVGLNNNYQWVDFKNEGIPGILTEQANEWFYKSNLGGGEFTNAIPLASRPSLNGLSSGLLQLQDIEADGSKQIVANSPGIRGFYELTDDGEWKTFQSFEQMPVIDWQDGNTRLIDLNGDGKADVLVTEENVFGWYPSAGKKGYETKEFFTKSFDEEQGPAIVFSDGTESIFLADMCGDGLTDILRIRNGEICYWPNMGYGKFGAKVTMSNAPFFDHPDQFNPAYLHLADVSGTGVTDILYLGKNQFKTWLNLSGNAWSNAYGIDPFFTTELPNQLAVIDLLGNGTACIVRSSSLPANANNPMRYIDLMGGEKPHIMRSYKNNFGKETTFEYKSSSSYYLEDKKNGTPWITKLPFPVQCVSKVIITDNVTDLRFTTHYKYHHGYFDHAEREFRGFGMVEQTDTEEFELLRAAGVANGTEAKLHEPPILTKTWFHVGAYLRNKKILDHFKHEYWYNNELLVQLYGDLSNKELDLPDALFIGEFCPQELREAHRACKGMVLRQEIFALDGTDKELLPYSVATHNCHIKKMQPLADNPFAVFTVQESEAINFSYERNPDDTRIAHSINIEIDDMGNVLKNAAIVYARKNRPAELTEDKIWNEQNKQHIIISENTFTKDVITFSTYRLRLPYDAKSFELQGVNLSGDKKYYSVADFDITTREIGYEKEFTGGLSEKRLIEHVKILYLANDLKSSMPEGEHDTLGLGYESYQLAFTESLLDNIYKEGVELFRVNAELLINGKYTDLNGDANWWIRSGTIQYLNEKLNETSAHAAQRFFLAQSYTDPFGSRTTVTYYPDYSLLLQQAKDQLENTSAVEKFDFRTLAPVRMKDMNGNIKEAVTDILGLLSGTAVMGKGNDADDLENFVTDPSREQLNAFFYPADESSQSAAAKDLLQHATSRLVYDFSKTPCVVATIVREEHYEINNDSKLQYSFEYSGGFGNGVLKKVQAEGGDAPYRNAGGELVKRENGELDIRFSDHRWVGNGRTILNNKGKPVKQYEPYFTDSHLYEDEPELREIGITPVLYYDAAGRLVKTEMPDKTFLKTGYDAWLQKSFDANDTVLESGWYTKRINPSQEDIDEFIKEGKDLLKEKAAAEKSSIHANTPATIHLDSLGRPFFSIAHNKRKDFRNNSIVGEFYNTQSILDIEGNLKAVIDACGNTVMSYKYDMLGHQVYQNSMDAGKRWMLNDSMGKPIYAWNSKDQQFIYSYDELHRPVTTTLLQNGSEIVVDRSEYVDTKGLDPSELLAKQELNLIGKPITQYDNAGITRLIKCDFKGITLETSRQYCKNYYAVPNWEAERNVEMENEIFISSSEFDALNRPMKILTPHTDPSSESGIDKIPPSFITPVYNEANLLNGVSVNIRGSETATEFVRNIDYDAKGQRQAIYYGNNTVARYSYDSKTFRLIRLLTRGNTGSKIFQDLQYTYDAVGNITHIYDNAFEPIFFNNQRIDALSEYDYDAIYQLIRATGREHAVQHINETASNNNSWNFPFEKIDSRDAQAVRGYTQSFFYDAVGNIMQMAHSAGAGSWTRNYWYNNNDVQRNELSINTTTIKNNQLLQTQIGHDEPTKYTHDIHGNILNLPQVQAMTWNYKDQLQQVDLGGGGKAYYVYDSTGQRIRKVIERNNSKKERLYFGAVEIYRERNSTNDITKQTDTLHIMDDTKRIAMVDTPVIPADSDETQVIRFIYGNHLGSSSLELNENAQTISYEEYHPYGTTAYTLGNSDIKAAAKRYRYTGMERDEETGLNYHHARYYANWLGRWTAVDPIGIGDSINLFCYCKNNPVIHQDMKGMKSQYANHVLPDPDLQKCTNDSDNQETKISDFETNLLSSSVTFKNVRESFLSAAVTNPQSVILTIPTQSFTLALPAQSFTLTIPKLSSIQTFEERFIEHYIGTSLLLGRSMTAWNATSQAPEPMSLQPITGTDKIIGSLKGAGLIAVAQNNLKKEWGEWGKNFVKAHPSLLVGVVGYLGYSAYEVYEGMQHHDANIKGMKPLAVANDFLFGFIDDKEKKLASFRLVTFFGDPALFHINISVGFEPFALTREENKDRVGGSIALKFREERRSIPDQPSRQMRPALELFLSLDVGWDPKRNWDFTPVITVRYWDDK